MPTLLNYQMGKLLGTLDIDTPETVHPSKHIGGIFTNCGGTTVFNHDITPQSMHEPDTHMVIATKTLSKRTYIH